MIIFVDLEHPRLQETHPELWETSLARRLKVKYRLEDISGSPCVIVRFSDLTAERLEQIHPSAVLVSGCMTDFEHYEPAHLARLREFFMTATTPALAFCGGHQQMAQAFGAHIAAIGELEAAEGASAAAQSEFAPGMKQERGFMPVENCRPEHPLMKGLASNPVFLQAHYWEVKDIPAGFDVLARSSLTAIQVLAHRERPLFGTQFHPEFYDRDHPDGRRLIENFFSQYV